MRRVEPSIEATTGVRREAIIGCRKAAGVPVRRRGRPREATAKPAISATEVSTDSGTGKPAENGALSTDPATPPRKSRAPSASACEPYRELIADALGRGRNAMAIWCQRRLKI